MIWEVHIVNEKKVLEIWLKEKGWLNVDLKKGADEFINKISNNNELVKEVYYINCKKYSNFNISICSCIWSKT